jgi:UDP-N-acetylglucosamine 2-epimerase
MENRERQTGMTIPLGKLRLRRNAGVRLTTVVGARPQFVKAAAVSRAILLYNGANLDARIVETLIHTGQHYDPALSRVFFDQLDIPAPQINLGVGSGPHGRQTAEMLIGLESALSADRPDLVLVYGDTNSTLAAALAAAKLGLPVAHVEAGMRSFTPRMPEEINRLLTDRLSALLLCSTPTAVRNLKAEGLTRGVRLVGDVMLDAFLMFREKAEARSGILSTLKLEKGGYVLATLHRQENTDDPTRLSYLLEAFARLSEKGRPIVIPLHPRTRDAIRRRRLRTGGAPFLHMIPPVPYLDMIALETGAAVILTDSGGVQKEAAFAGVPCLTLREETEWPETVEKGWNRLVGSDPERIAKAFQAAIKAPRPAARAAVARLFGRGAAGRRIAAEIAKFGGAGTPGKS